MLKVYASQPVGKKAIRNEQQRAAKQGIENLPASAARGAIMGRRNRRAGGAGGRR